MPSSLIRGKYVICRVTGEESAQVLEDAAVFQQDGEIVEVGPYSDLTSRHRPDEKIGSSDMIVIPGLVNAHHHVGLTPFQLGALDAPLETWVIARMANRDVDPYLDTLYCAMQMIESGITTVMHNHGLARLPVDASPYDSSARIIQAYQESGMRVAFSLSYRDQNQLLYEEDEEFLATLPADLRRSAMEYSEARPISHEDYLSLCADLLSSNQSERTRVLISPHNVHTCSDTLLRQISDFGARHSAGIHIHLQETIYQKMYGTRHWDKTPLGHLHDLGLLGPAVSCAHGVWLTDSDMDILAETGTIICHNPSSNLRLKSGIAPLNRMIEKGVSVAIGIDEAGINDDNDILQEMRLVQKLHRVPGAASPSPTSHQILQMATVNGAKATLFGDRVGTLEPGQRADVVLVSLERISEPYLAPETDIVDALVYRGKGLDVDTVIVDGQVLLRNKRLTNLDKDEVISRLKDSLSGPLRPHEVQRRELGRRLLPYAERFLRGRSLHQGAPHYFYNERA